MSPIFSKEVKFLTHLLWDCLWCWQTFDKERDMKYFFEKNTVLILFLDLVTYRIGVPWRPNWFTLKCFRRWKRNVQQNARAGLQSCMWLHPNLLATYSYLFFWKSVFSTSDMLWELCTLWNIWVCYGKQHDTLHNQTDYTKTASDLGETVDSWVCVKLLFQLLLSSCLRNWISLPDHMAIVFLTKANQIKK